MNRCSTRALDAVLAVALIAGVTLLPVVTPAGTATETPPPRNPWGLTPAGNSLFFVGDDDQGRALWKSDGTWDGTVKLREVGTFLHPTVVGDTLFFVNTSESYGYELWKSDGTADGTVIVKDIAPGSVGSFPDWLTAVGDTLYFVASDDEHGGELWKSDGTADGTVIVKDIAPGSEGSDLREPKWLIGVGGTLFFAHQNPEDPEGRRAIYRSDGTEEGTVMIKGGFFEPGDFTVVGDSFYFSELVDFEPTEYQLWKSDGTAQGTYRVVDKRFTGRIWEPTSFAEKLFFAASVGQPRIPELWTSDGTENGTMVVEDLNAQTGSAPEYLTVFNEHLYFSARDDSFHRELWRTDGTAAGTARVKDINSGTSYDLRDLTAADGSLFFTAGQDIRRAGRDLWKTEGTGAGTVLVKPSSTWSDGPLLDEVTALQGDLFFSAQGANNLNAELWKSDGTGSGTVPVRTVPSTSATKGNQGSTDAPAARSTQITPARASAGNRAGNQTPGAVGAFERSAPSALTRASTGNRAPKQNAGTAVDAVTTCDGLAATPGTTYRDGAYHGTPGDDVIVLYGAYLTIYAGAGDDTICVDEDSEAYGGDRIFGGRGNDRIFAEWGSDDLSGGRGNDYLYGGADRDTFDGGPGNDVLDAECVHCFGSGGLAPFLDVGSVHADLIEGVARTDKGTDILVSIDRIQTGPGDDVLRGDGRVNTFHGGSGNDRLFGRGADDKLAGGRGSDSADGGAGKDRCKAERLVRCES